MLARYKIYVSQKRPVHDPLPDGIRIPTTYHHNHFRSPQKDLVFNYLAHRPEDQGKRYKQEYLSLLEERISKHKELFDELAKWASEKDVYLGCVCPTKKNPHVEHCHTWLALEFIKRKYTHLKIVFPPSYREKLESLLKEYVGEGNNE